MKKNSTNATINVRDTDITVIRREDEDYISLTDIAKHREPARADHVIQNWMRNRNTVEFLGMWESLNNADFKPLEFEGFKNRAGLNSFVLTPRQWIENTAAVGIVSKSGRYGGTLFIHMELPQSDRIKRLNAIAIRQMQTLTARTAKQLEGGSE